VGFSLLFASNNFTPNFNLFSRNWGVRINPPKAHGNLFYSNYIKNSERVIQKIAVYFFLLPAGEHTLKESEVFYAITAEIQTVVSHER